MSVYFITARKIGLVKIGYTDGDPKRRMAGLRTSCPAKLKLEACVPGSVKEERELHERFAQYRTHGEWFKLSPELDAFIREVGLVEQGVAILKPSKRAGRPSDEEFAAAYDERCKAMLAEAMRDFAALGPLPDAQLGPEPRRFYNPAPTGCGCFNAHFAVRGGGRRFCEDMHLTWDQADRLCDVFEEVRREAQRSLDLELTRQRERAA